MSVCLATYITAFSSLTVCKRMVASARMLGFDARVLGLAAVLIAGCYDSSAADRSPEAQAGASAAGPGRDGGPRSDSGGADNGSADGGARDASTGRAGSASPVQAGSGGVNGAAASGSTAGSSSVGGMGATSGTGTAANAGTGNAGIGGELPEQFNPGCTEPQQCTLVPKGCCQPCGPSTADDYFAVQASMLEEVREELDCEEKSCPRCGGVPQPSLVPACVSGKCASIDTREQVDVSACNAHSDCVLRFASCCECDVDSPELLVAVSNAAAYEVLICGSRDRCEGCNPNYPPTARAFCDRGKCDVALPRP